MILIIVMHPIWSTHGGAMHGMFECIVFLNQCKVALSGYALKDFINLVVMHWMDAYEKYE